MAQVLIVSNRLPISVRKEDGKLLFSPSIGGLATGLASYVSNRHNRWVGWPGIANDELTESDRQAIVAELAKHHCTPVFLSQRQINDYYNGYSNSILWPLFHNLPYRDKDQIRHHRWWQAYREVNKRFTEVISTEADANSHVWVHDYQLLLVPQLLRTESPTATIGFFLHIPFPGPKAFSKLSEHGKLLSGLLGADLVGFHTSGYAEDFMKNCLEAGQDIVDEHTIKVSERLVRIGEFPMGIDYERYALSSQTQLVKAAIRRYKQRYRGLKVIAAVDRLDPSKGLVERLEAYREFLAQNIALHGRVVFAMIAAPSRTDIAVYKALSKRLDALVAQINKTYGSGTWQPVDYINTAQPFEEVSALFAVADVAFIAPLKDGMNLAAKEYVASARRHGALILSETAGAAKELRAALLVNPRRPASLVNALQESLTMPKSELGVRMRKMQRYLERHSVQHWAKSFIDTLQTPMPGTPALTYTLRKRLEHKLIDEYRAADKRLLLLDYDGSLVPLRRDFTDSKPPQTLIKTLQQLSRDERNEIVLISGRDADDLERWFGNVSINLVAEHGAVTKRSDRDSWQAIEGIETRWKRAIRPVLEKYTAQAPGTRVESKPHSLVWHYRGAPPYYAQKYLVILKRVLKPLLKAHGVKLYQGHKIIEIKNPKITKDRAARRWLRQRHDFILSIGDDYTDEDLFAILPQSSYSIKVGRGLTKAHYRLANSSDIQKLLKQLTK